MSRRTAREVSLKLLYQHDFHKENLDEQIETFLENLKEEKIHDDMPIKSVEEKDIAFIKEVVKGTISNIEEIDKKVEELAIGWPLARIAKVDLAVLRLAVYEMLYRDDIPKEVAINEAVELAKKYSTEGSGSFVNGVLGKVVK